MISLAPHFYGTQPVPALFGICQVGHLSQIKLFPSAFSISKQPHLGFTGTHFKPCLSGSKPSLHGWHLWHSSAGRMMEFLGHFCLIHFNLLNGSLTSFGPQASHFNNRLSAYLSVHEQSATSLIHLVPVLSGFLSAGQSTHP